MYRLKRIFWICMTVMSYLMLGGMGWLLSSCEPKARLSDPGVYRFNDTIAADSVRARLEWNVKGSGNQLEIIQNNTKTTVKTYENADSIYSTTIIVLP